MKKIFIALIILSFFSCKEDVQKPSIDAELLKKFNWQHVEKQNQKINDQEVSYNDTISYFFSGNTFQRKTQHTTLNWSVGSPVVKNQKTYSSEGKYELNIADSTLIFTQKHNGTILTDDLVYYLPRMGEVTKNESLINN